MDGQEMRLISEYMVWVMVSGVTKPRWDGYRGDEAVMRIDQPTAGGWRVMWTLMRPGPNRVGRYEGLAEALDAADEAFGEWMTRLRLTAVPWEDMGRLKEQDRRDKG